MIAGGTSVSRCSYVMNAGTRHEPVKICKLCAMLARQAPKTSPQLSSLGLQDTRRKVADEASADVCVGG